MARTETWSDVNVKVKRQRKVTRIYRALTITDVVPARYLGEEGDTPERRLEKRQKCFEYVMGYWGNQTPAYARETVLGFLRDVIVDGDPMGYLPLIDYAREVGADALADVVVNTFAKACRAILEKSSARSARAVMKAYREVREGGYDTPEYQSACSAIIAEYVSRCQTAPKAREVKG